MKKQKEIVVLDNRIYVLIQESDHLTLVFGAMFVCERGESGQNIWI